MGLPYPTKVILPFDIATAQDMNERHANDVALAAGSGLDDDAIVTSKIDDGAVTADKIDFTTLRLGKSSVTSSFSTTAALASPAEITGLATTVVLEETRTIRVTIVAYSWFNSGSTGYNRLTITNGTFSSGTIIATASASFTATNQELNPTTLAEVTLPAGTYTFRVYLGRNNNTATLSASSTSPAFMTVDVVA